MLKPSKNVPETASERASERKKAKKQQTRKLIEKIFIVFFFSSKINFSFDDFEKKKSVKSTERKRNFECLSKKFFFLIFFNQKKFNKIYKKQ